MKTKTKVHESNLILIVAALLAIPLHLSASDLLFTGDRRPFVLCPKHFRKNSTGIYPLATELCSESFTYCAAGRPIPGTCPNQLYFNPDIGDCDNIAAVDKCTKKYMDAKEPGKLSKLRFIETEPKYIDCNFMPCNFYPDTDNDGDASKYVFCNAGKTVRRNCPRGHLFDMKTFDCQLEKVALTWQVPKLGQGKKEVDNPITDDSDKKLNSIEFQAKSSTSVFSMNPVIGIYTIQNPPSSHLPDDAIWSDWKLCPNGTFIRKMDNNGYTCSIPVRTEKYLGKPLGEIFPVSPKNGARPMKQNKVADASSSNSEDDEKSRMSKRLDSDANRTGVQTTSKQEENVVPYPVDNTNFLPVNCLENDGGAINGFEIHDTVIQFFCANGPTKKVINGAICSDFTAVCGLSVMTSGGDVINVRAQCCSVKSPLLKPKEGLALINSFDNSDGDFLRKFRFETGVYGITTSKEDRHLQAFYVSLGFTFSALLKDLEQSLREKTNCLKNSNCLYPWRNFEFKSKVMLVVQKKLVIPPRSKAKLFQVYALVGYFRVYTNRFIQVIENLDTNVIHEEVMQISDEDLSLPKRKQVFGEELSEGLPSPFIANDLNEGSNKPWKMCPFHDLPASKYVDREPPNGVIISNPVIHEVGQWTNWQNCSDDAYINRVRQITHAVKNDKRTDQVGVVQLGLGCRQVKVKREKDTSTNHDTDDSEENNTPEHDDTVELEFVNPGFTRKKWTDDTWKGGICNHGVFVGFQVKTSEKSEKDIVGTKEIRMICSCDETDLNNAQATDSDADSVGSSSSSGSAKGRNYRKIIPAKDGWTEERICEPFQALQGLVTQEHTMKTDVKKYDNHGLTNIKMKCADIPNPAEMCTPKERKVLISRCTNNVANSHPCHFNATVGVSYYEKAETQFKANVLESVGYTLGCVTPKLQQNFVNKFPHISAYKEPIWQPITQLVGQIPTEPGTSTDIYQMIGECEPYKVHTNKFIRQSNTEEKIDLPLPPIEKSPCWQDYVIMDRVNEISFDRKKPSLDSVLRFHSQFPTANFTLTTDGIVRTSPHVTNFGNWQKGWKFCPPSTYINGISASRYHDNDDDHLGVAYIGFHCVDPQSGASAAMLSFKTPGLPSQNKNFMKKWFSCSEKGSTAYGFQLFVKPPQGGISDNVATNNALLLCSGGEDAIVVFDKEDEDEDDHDYGQSGLWTHPQTCEPKQALCGISAQFQSYQSSSLENGTLVDNTGLNNIKAKCCELTHPGSTCTPLVKRVLVGRCDNSNSPVERFCKITIDIGVSFSPDSIGTSKRNFYESIGFTKECYGKALEKTFSKGPTCKVDREDCEMEWDELPKHVWMAGKPFTEFITVPGRKRTDIYQIQGHCDDAVVKTNRYVIYNLVKELPMTDDPRMGAPCWEDQKPQRADILSENKIRMEPGPRFKILKDPAHPEYNFVEGGATLTSPTPDIMFVDETEDDQWEYCHNGAKDNVWYIDSIYVERQGTVKDRAGLVAIAFNCRNPKLTGEGDHVISGVTPGAVTLDKGMWDWKSCECGAGIGMQTSFVPPQQLGDDLGIESFRLLCSCSDSAWKSKQEYPKDLQGRRGDWSREHYCRPRQAICGMMTRSKSFKVRESLLAWDNMGITQVTVKCCDVPNPAATCQPKDALREIGVCENQKEGTKSKCLLDTVVGVTYDHGDKGRKNLANFYESIGWGLDCTLPDLEKNFRLNMDMPEEDVKYIWDKSKAYIWRQASTIQDIIDIQDLTRTVVYQVVGECGPYLVATDKFIREDISLRNEDNVVEDAFRYTKSIRQLPVTPCWAHGTTFPARDLIDTAGKYNTEQYPFHGLPSPGKFVLSNLTDEGVELECPERIPGKNSVSRLREECIDGGFLVGYAINRAKVENDDLGMVHLLTRCKKLSNLTQKGKAVGNDEDNENGDIIGSRQKQGQDKGQDNKGEEQLESNDEDEDKMDGSKPRRKGKQELIMQHPGENFDKQKLSELYQNCLDGVLVGFQVKMDPVILRRNHYKPPTDEVGIDAIRMVRKMCSLGKPIEPEPFILPKENWTHHIEACRPYQAFCAFSAKFGPKSVGDWKKVDGTGITQVRVACCDVPSPAHGNPKEILKLVSVCNNLQYDNDRECETELDIGVTYDFDENPEESKMHLSVGYSIPCVINDLRKTFRNARRVTCVKEGSSSCTYNWKKELNSKIFQHGLSSQKNITIVKAHTRLNIYQTMAKVNSLLVLSNEFELVTSETNGKEVNRQKITIHPKKFPELKEKLICDHSTSSRPRPKVDEFGKLVPDKMNAPRKLHKKDSIPPKFRWNPSHEFKEIDGVVVVATNPPSPLEGNSKSAKKSFQWDDWMNCPQDTFVSYISPEVGGKSGGVVKFSFKCINPNDGRLHDNVNVGIPSTNQGKSKNSDNDEHDAKSHTSPGWKVKALSGIKDSQQDSEDIHDEPNVTKSKSKNKKSEGRDESKDSGDNDGGNIDPVESAKPDKKDIGCSCPGVPFSVLVGVQVKSSDKSGVLWALSPFCPCNNTGLEEEEEEEETNEKLMETLACQERQAICGFQVQKSPKDEEIYKLQVACCDVPSPLTGCDIREALHRSVICDNLFYDKERNCSFSVDVGVGYDFENYREQIQFYEAMGWSANCMKQDIADEFGEKLGSGPGSSKDWAKTAKISPLGKEWEKVQESPYEIPVKSQIKLEVFQAMGQCNMFNIYSDRFFLSESSAASGAVTNYVKNIENKSNDSNTIRADCMEGEAISSRGNLMSILGRSMGFMPPDFHGYEASKTGDKLYSLGDGSSRTGYRIWAKNRNNTKLETNEDEIDLSQVVLCHEETYIRKYSSENPDMMYFLCTTSNYTTANQHSLDGSSASKGYKYQQSTPAAYIGLAKDSDNEGKTRSDNGLSLVSSIPLKSKSEEQNEGKGKKGKNKKGKNSEVAAEYCHPGQAICGIQRGADRAAICCTVENPAEMCEPKEKTVLSAVCDNRRSRCGKCIVKVGVGVTYNFEDHPKSSYFYSSIGYTAENTRTLKKKLQSMSCVSQGNCDYSWGSAPPTVWDRVQVNTFTTECLPYQRVEYHQKIVVCAYPQGELLIYSPVLERRAGSKDGKDIKISEVVASNDISDVVKEESKKSRTDEPKLKFMNLTDRPPKTNPVDYGPLKLTSALPVDEAAIPTCAFHAMPESDHFEYFPSTKDGSIILTGPVDLDLELNLKPKWGTWKECDKNSYVKQIEAYISTLTMESDDEGDTKVDAMGVKQFILQCASSSGKNTTEIELKSEKAMAKPEDEKRKYRPCQDGAVAVGFIAQMREYQGPLIDDNSYVNFKQLCSCGKHGVSDFPTATPRDFIIGDWETPQICKPRQAICGYNHQHLELEIAEGDLSKTIDSFLLVDNVGITGIKAKCCYVPSPALECEPVEQKTLVAECDNSAVKKGSRMCEIEVDVGLSYIHDKNAMNVSNFYESIGWNLECQKEELFEKFSKQLGPSKVLKGFDWVSTKEGKLWNPAVKGKFVTSLTPKAKQLVYQIIGVCGIYRIHTNVFSVVDDKHQKDNIEIADIGNSSPDPCWTDLSPLKGRNWIAQMRYDLKPSFDIYTEIKKDNVEPWEADDKSGRIGCKIQTPLPPLPYFKWQDARICPLNSYIRSFSVRRIVHHGADYMSNKTDVYGVVGVAYHCMFPNMTVAEEVIYTFKPFEKSIESRRTESKRIEKHNAPGNRYQYCLGPAMGVEVESVPESNVLIDNYGILDLRFMCKTIGKDSEYGHKVDLIGVEINPPVVHANAVCKAKQALCSFQGAFSKGINKKQDSYAMSNVKIGCCNVPSPLEGDTPETLFVLAGTCDNLVFNRKRKCQYTLGIGIQYDVRNQKEASYFYMGVGYTPTCLSEDIKDKFPELLKSPPQVFQEVNQMKLTIELEPKTKVDIYQLVGTLNEVLVKSNVIQKVTFNRKLKEIDRQNSTERSNLPKVKHKECEVEGLEMDSTFTEMGKVEKIVNYEKPERGSDECKYKERIDAAPYLFFQDHALEGVRDLNIERNHNTTWNDYRWTNCSEDGLFTGFDMKSGEVSVPGGAASKRDVDKYGIGALAIQCEGIQDHETGKEVLVQFSRRSGLGKSDFVSRSNSKTLRDGVSCKNGVAIGFSQQNQPFRKTADDEGMTNFKLHCSCGDIVTKEVDKDNPDDSDAQLEEKNEVKRKHKSRKGGDRTTGNEKVNDGDNQGVNRKEKKIDLRWTEPKYCRPREALCGFTIMAQQQAYEPIRKHDNVGITNIRARCCPVDSPAHHCVPAEKLALIGQCGNAKGSTKKGCRLDLFVGLTYDRRPENDRSIKMYEGLGWGLSCVKDSLAGSFAQSIKSSKQFNWKKNKLSKIWNKLKKKFYMLTAETGRKTKVYQVIGLCGFYKVYTGKFIIKHEDAKGVASSESVHNFEAIASEGWDTCWEDSTPIRGRDFLLSIISAPMSFPLRKTFQSTKQEMLDYKWKEEENALHGYVIRSPHPESPYREWSMWKYCPKGTYIRGWASVASGMANKRDSGKEDYSGVVFVKAICQTPNNTPSKQSTLSILQPNNMWDESSWTRQGRYSHLYCVGAGIGIQGMMRLRSKVAGDNETRTPVTLDKFYFHDTKLVCSSGLDAGFMREGIPPVDEKQRQRDELAKEHPVEACKPRYALCGFRVTWGKMNLGDFRKQDGFGISNMQALCCEVPQPMSRCNSVAERLVHASTCDNTRGTVPRSCMYNLGVGIAYNFQDYEATSIFYQSNGFTSTCIASDVQNKFKVNRPKPCSEKGCKYKWDEAPDRMWQETGTVSFTQEVQPKQRFKVYQLVGECNNVMVLTNQFVKVTKDRNEKELTRETWIMDDLPPDASKKCETGL